MSKGLILQFIKFGLVGVSNTVISFGVYYVLLWLGIHYLVANTLGFLISVINAYFWNSRYVFNSNQKSGIKAFIKVFTSYGFTFLLSMGLLYLLVQFLGVSEWLAPVLIMFITVPTNFLLNKLWAFREKKETS